MRSQLSPTPNSEEPERADVCLDVGVAKGEAGELFVRTNGEEHPLGHRDVAPDRGLVLAVPDDDHDFLSAAHTGACTAAEGPQVPMSAAPAECASRAASRRPGALAASPAARTAVAALVRVAQGMVEAGAGAWDAEEMVPSLAYLVWAMAEEASDSETPDVTAMTTATATTVSSVATTAPASSPPAAPAVAWGEAEEEDDEEGEEEDTGPSTPPLGDGSAPEPPHPSTVAAAATR